MNEDYENINKKELYEQDIYLNSNTKRKVGSMNERQKRFADYYIETGNATQSAIKAGYSKKTAEIMGHENLRKPKIKSYIDERLKMQSDERIATAEEVLQLLTKMARGQTEEEIATFNPAHGETEIISKKVSGREQVKAQELLGKRYRLFVDKIDVTANVPIKIIDDIEDDC
jgi:phage terminase small subunit